MSANNNQYQYYVFMPSEEHLTSGRKFTIELSDTRHRVAEPCRYFAKYKGTRLPMCSCMPCFNKFIESQKAKGKQVFKMPEGWSPNNAKYVMKEPVQRV